VSDARQLDSPFRPLPDPLRRGSSRGTGVAFVFPAITQSIPQTGLYSYFSVAGDFEMAANYELLSMRSRRAATGVTCGIVGGARGPGQREPARGRNHRQSSGYVVIA